MRISHRSNEQGSNKHNIILVDDDHDIVDVLGRGLEMEGLHVQSYISAQEALLSFKPNTYDLAIVDIRMPAMTGFQLFRKIQKLDGHCGLFSFCI